MTVDQVYGGILNLFRHCRSARLAGLDAVLATPDGQDSYGETWGIGALPIVAWADRRPGDLAVLTDIFSSLIPDTEGPVIAYMQHPNLIRHDFPHSDPRIQVWTDSPFMKARCEAAYPRKTVRIVPNVVDPEAFPFIPQQDRTPGLVFAFPRKGADFIDATERAYRGLGGRYFRFERIDGLPFHALAEAFRRPQVFLASADDEGCALPPQESMAAGIVVVGKDARGANFCMRDQETALVAQTPEGAAEALRKAESAELRTRLSRAGHDFIRRYFPDGEPMALWQGVKESLSDR